MGKEFERYHPLVILIYFALVIVFSMTFIHPVCVVISFTAAMLYSVVLGGFKLLRRNVVISIPMILLSGAINIFFNRAGDTVIGNAFGNAVTFEALLYGALMGGMVASSVSWFSCFARVMDDDKFTYLFGRLSPTLALILSMTFRLIPQFTRRFKETYNAHRCMKSDKSRFRLAGDVLQILFAHSLEGAIITSDSMRARGFGRGKRSSFSNYKFTLRDITALIYALTLGTYIFVSAIYRTFEFACVPSIVISYNIWVFMAYGALLVLPIIIEIKEGLVWKLSRRRI